MHKDFRGRIGRMNVQTRKIPEHEAIYLRVRDAIMFGELVPGQSVTIQGLTEMIGAGMTPAREAIRRLTSEGALVALGNRRIEVPRLSSDALSELQFARCAIEPKLAEMALNGRNEQLARKLRHIDDKLDQSIATGSVEGYLRHNHDFHFTLYEASGAEILVAMARSLWLRSGPSLRVVCGRFGTANLPDMHDEALAAILSGSAERLHHAIKVDIEQGIDQIAKSIAESSVDDGN